MIPVKREGGDAECRRVRSYCLISLDFIELFHCRLRRLCTSIRNSPLSICSKTFHKPNRGLLESVMKQTATDSRPGYPSWCSRKCQLTATKNSPDNIHWICTTEYQLSPSCSSSLPSNDMIDIVLKTLKTVENVSEQIERPDRWKTQSNPFSNLKAQS